ncbi:MAG TPA: type II secretion system F family protein [Jatrophihabitans sp.]|uniref:type II secretion system F family protein n=1 Tax=Jatrophihabitans sp. TaxID=1932789 RepID=UPI002DFB5FED|nr:type II secretion system F family protein [Jatrophihabitans sp.]
MTLAWCLVAMALLVLAPRPAAVGHRRAITPAAAAPPSRTLLWVGGIATIATACLLVAGPVAGGAAALVIAPLAAAALRRGRARPSAPRVDRALPLYLDLVAAALRAGRPLAEALVIALPAATSPTAEPIARVAGLLRLGAEPEQAWSAVPRDGPLGAVRATAVRSASSGLRLAAGFERLASDVRAELATAATARAHRAGVFSMAPLGLCFLPSFVCLGVIPVVVGIARTALGVMP